VLVIVTKFFTGFDKRTSFLLYGINYEPFKSFMTLASGCFPSFVWQLKGGDIFDPKKARA